MDQSPFHSEATKPPPDASVSRELPILEKFVAAYKQWHAIRSHIPKSHRHTVAVRIEKLFQEVLEYTLACRYSHRDEKRRQLHALSSRLDNLKFYLKLAWELRAFDHKKYAAISCTLLEAGNMLGGWLKTI